MSGPVVAIHAGAGGRGGTPDEEPEECRAALLQALAAARTVLESPGGGPVDAVQAAIMVMEDFPLFNAGHGSVLCADGSVELSAAIMDSDRRQAGAVAAARTSRHPIAAARSLLAEPQVLLVGATADAHAAAAGVEQLPNHSFATERQRQRLAQRGASPGQRPRDDFGTVGAVCRAADGRLAAGTSTGGMRGQPPGRVGDCPVIGAGTWADRGVAISCTGDGEAFIRVGAARLIGALVEHGVSLEQAAQRALSEVSQLGGEGGLIAVGADDTATLPFITERMPRGMWRAGAEPTVWVTD